MVLSNQLCRRAVEAQKLLYHGSELPPGHMKLPENVEWLKTIRRKIHEHPELAFEELDRLNMDGEYQEVYIRNEKKKKKRRG
ncbi:hypothetical protein PRUPE_3G187900 [Prunus persica]|uniref:Uncharacterized protein n=1 Tax=Prunus persica TaxID=3760 RepID=A0A251Q2F4_PRUPE|nr:hypothetical protein PRUPE_3G187900 [Prunus persica]